MKNLFVNISYLASKGKATKQKRISTNGSIVLDIYRRVNVSSIKTHVLVISLNADGDPVIAVTPVPKRKSEIREKINMT